MQLGICVLLGLAASVEDLWRRRISNFTVLAGLVAGLALQVTARGWRSGLGAWAGGAAIGFLIFLVFFLAGGMGAGDIKLMAAFGSCLGTRQILWAALWTPAGPGEYRLKVRARDGGGVVQVERPSPTLPDGATGYHSIRVRVEK